MTRTEILDQAKERVCGKRELDYGKPENNFNTIADLWMTYLNDKVIITGKDVAMMMALMKIARIKTGTATEDSFVDLAGYAACGGEVSTRNCLEAVTENISDPVPYKPIFSAPEPWDTGKVMECAGGYANTYNKDIYEKENVRNEN